MSSEAERRIRVEVAYALPEQQALLAVVVPAGSTARQAIDASGIRERFPGLVIDPEGVGVFGRKVALEHVLRDGDRVEIYRPLQADPKEVRRRRASGEKPRKGT